MNASLFTSLHGVAAALLVLGFVVWQRRAGLELGRVPRSDVDFLLWSGWVALAGYLVVYAYVARKYVHRVRWSPEFRLRVPRQALERAETRLGEIRAAAARGALVGAGEVRRRAQEVLREEGCARIARAVVETEAGGRLRLRLAPSEPLGRVASWMHAHVYYGLAGGALVLLHGGGRFDSPASIALNGLSLLVIATGVLGILLWALGPSWMTRRERDLSIEEAFALDRHLGRKLEGVLASEKDRAALAVFRNVERARRYPRESARAGLAALLAERPQDAPAIRDAMVLAGQKQRAAAGLEDLMRLRLWLNAWRAVHVPASILLLVAVAVHVASVLLY